MVEQMDLTMVNWARAQFAMTAMYHWVFVPLTLGLSFLIAFFESIYVKTGNEEWKKIAKFWMILFGINFAIGVATGIILEFEFGTNWSNYSWMVGDIFGAPLAVEGIVAFFLEATFFAVMFFGWDRVSKRFHLFSTWMVAIGANLSALWILVANGWMQFPTGMAFNPDTARFEMHDFWAVLFSPVAISKFTHTTSSGFLFASLFVVTVSSWYLLKKRHVQMARKSILVAAVFGLLSSGYVAITGDEAAYNNAHKQPMKLAAFEGLYEGEKGAGLAAVGIVNPGKKVNDDQAAFLFEVRIPGLLSLLANRSPGTFVPGIKDLVYGNKEEGVMGAEEKIKMGRVAVEQLSMYKQAKRAGDTGAAQAALVRFNAEPGLSGVWVSEVPGGGRSARRHNILCLSHDGDVRGAFPHHLSPVSCLRPERHAGSPKMAPVPRVDFRIPRVCGGPVRLDSSGSGSAALGYPEPSARRRGALQLDGRGGADHVFHVFGHLYDSVDRRNQDHVETDTDRTGGTLKCLEI